MVNFKPGEYTRMMFFSQSHRQLGNKNPITPVTFWLLDVQMLYHCELQETVGNHGH